MDKLIGEIHTIYDEISQHEIKIMELEERKEQLFEELGAIRQKQLQSENIAWRQMKL